LVIPQPSELGEGGESPLRCIYSIKHLILVLAILSSCSDTPENNRVCIKTKTEVKEINGTLVEVSECKKWAEQTDAE